jgi:hypothetical protein
MNIDTVLGGKPKAKKEEKEPKKGAKKHPFHRTVIEHHDNGSHTVKHEHESMEPGKDVSYAVPDLDGVHDGLEEHCGEPNEGEAELSKGASVVEPALAGKK